LQNFTGKVNDEVEETKDFKKQRQVEEPKEAGKR